MSIPSSIFLAVKADLFRDLAFEAIHSESVSRVLNILEKNSDDSEVDSSGNRCFYLSEVNWYGNDVDVFMNLLRKRPADYIFFEDCWEYPEYCVHGNWNDSVWNPGWDGECGLSFRLIN
jgi:hypothetical protein